MSQHNRYCGPFALSRVLGITTGEAAARIREHTGKKFVTGTPSQSIGFVLADAGELIATETYGKERHSKIRGPKLRDWAANHAGERWIVLVPYHYVVLGKGGKVSCAQNEEGAKPHKHHYGHRHVKAAWQVRP